MYLIKEIFTGGHQLKKDFLQISINKKTFSQKKKIYNTIKSSYVNEVIRAILNFFIYLRKDFTTQKSTKRLQANKKKKCS